MQRGGDSSADPLMTLELQISKELESRLIEEARKCGMEPEEYTLRLMDRHIPPADAKSRLIDLVQSWIDEGNETEQKETGDFLIEALDQDRMSDRKLFPPELKGVTW